MYVGSRNQKKEENPISGSGSDGSKQPTPGPENPNPVTQNNNTPDKLDPIDIDFSMGKPDNNITMNPVEIPRPEPMIDGKPIEAGRRIRFDHWPFGSNDYVVRNPSKTNEFLGPIVEKLKSNPHLAITIQVLTNLTPDQLKDNLATVHLNMTGNQLMWNRGLAIQQALINMGVDSRQVVFMYQPGVPNGGGINIVVRKK